MVIIFVLLSPFFSITSFHLCISEKCFFNLCDQRHHEKRRFILNGSQFFGTDISTRLTPDGPSNRLLYFSDVLPLTQTLGDEGVQHALVAGSEALSGKWVLDMVKSGTDSWRPLHLLVMCSVPCVKSALVQVNYQ